MRETVEAVETTTAEEEFTLFSVPTPMERVVGRTPEALRSETVMRGVEPGDYQVVAEGDGLAESPARPA